MYEAKQNKEKVSRRIDGGEAIQRIKARYDKVIEKQNNSAKHDVVQYQKKTTQENRNVIQLRRTLECTATVEAHPLKKNGKNYIVKSPSFYTGEGKNGGGDSQAVQDNLNDYAKKQINLLHKFKDISSFVKVVTLKQPSQSPGWQWGNCAEPHALRNALDSIPHRATVIIKNIKISEAHDVGKDTKEPRCSWCAQWAPDEEIFTAKLPMML